MVTSIWDDYSSAIHSFRSVDPTVYAALKTKIKFVLWTLRLRPDNLEWSTHVNNIIKKASSTFMTFKLENI